MYGERRCRVKIFFKKGRGWRRAVVQAAMEENTTEMSRMAAARWYARLRAPDCTQLERKEFDEWLRQSEDNAAAYRKAEKLACMLAAAARNEDRFSDLATSALAKPLVSNITRWRVAAVLTLGIALALAGVASRHAGNAELMVNHFNSGKQQQRYALADGSVVYLDVGSRISIRMTKAHRSVDLLEGRAFFEVTHDEHRPFYVNAGELKTVDVGTRFQVSLSDSHDVSVTLVEGAVRISDQKDSGKWNQTLLPGEQALLKAGTATLLKRDVDATSLTSWSTGRLVFKGTPLQEALEEVNRYSDCKIHLGDATLASIPIGGNFIAGGDSTQVIDALAAVLPLRVVRVGSNEIVLFQRN